MKVGIMTFPNSTSFGAVLQMYALHRAVEQLGAESEIINYHNVYMKAERHTSAIQSAKGLNKKLRLWGKRVIHARQFYGFRQFEKKLSMYPEHPILEMRELQAVGKRYECVICGSDQVWNPYITDCDLSFFLDFCGKETKRIAYAPSFGISEFAEDFQNRIRGEIEKFGALSAREQEGQQLLQQLTGKQIPLVLDPTFLLEKEEWVALEKPHPLAVGEYILYFTVSRSPELFRFCKELARKDNKKVIIVGGNFVKQLRNKDKTVEYAWDLAPGEWLYLMHHACCIVTNSFHGTAFSIHYQMDFYVEFSSNTNSRLEQIVRTAGLESRVVRSGCAQWNEHIDYSQVTQKLVPALELSKAYLKDSIQ